MLIFNLVDLKIPAILEQNHLSRNTVSIISGSKYMTAFRIVWLIKSVFRSTNDPKATMGSCMEKFLSAEPQ